MEPSEQINAVVDKLADKLGVAVEQLAPIAETVVREVAIRGAALAGLSLCILGVTPVLWWIMFRAIAHAADDDGKVTDKQVAAAIVAGIFSIFTFGIGTAQSIVWIKQWLAPTWHVVNTMLR